jgi:hypothetical protein
MAYRHADTLREGSHSPAAAEDVRRQPTPLPSGLNVGNDEGVEHPFEALEGHWYALLIIFRKSGQPGSTPVWFVLAGVRSFTDAEIGKVKRIRSDSWVMLGPLATGWVGCGARVFRQRPGSWTR